MDIIERLASTPMWPSAHEIAATALDTVELVPRPDQPPPDEIGASRFAGHQAQGSFLNCRIGEAFPAGPCADYSMR